MLGIVTIKNASIQALLNKKKRIFITHAVVITVLDKKGKQ